MKKIVALICVLCVVILAFSMCGTKEKEVTITVPEGASVKSVAKMLKENDLITSKFLFERKVAGTVGYI